MESDNDINEPNIVTLPERRRAIFERTVARYAVAGITLDDPDYLQLIDLWVAGEIEMRDATIRWADIGRDRYPGLEKTSDLREITTNLEEIPKMSEAELLAEIAKLPGE